MTPAGMVQTSRKLHYSASAAQTPDGVVSDIASGLPRDALSALFLMTPPRADLPELASALAAAFPDVLIFGCTTAGEITDAGYADDVISAVGFDRRSFAFSTVLLEEISALSFGSVPDRLRQACDMLDRKGGQGERFAMLLVDGTSQCEEKLVSALARDLGRIPLVGGSAGDGLAFQSARVLHRGAFHDDAALVVIVDSLCPFEIFKFENFEPTDQKMVVTEADPDNRLVTEINAEPAAPEYARMVGLDPHQLSPFVFAAYPVIVRVGGEYHVRAIQKVEPNGALKFYCAIDEGLVLTVAQSVDMARQLDDGFADMASRRGPVGFALGFDCILRRLAAEQNQQVRAVSEALKRNRVIGFSTYGEQYRSMHVNQTLTGVAFFEDAHV